MIPNDAAWTVTGHQETTGQLDSGAFGEGVKVTFRTAAGWTGSVFIPRAEYTTENVARAINAKAQTMAEIAALQG
jgi:hypothetical protein